MTPADYAILTKALRELAAICDHIAGMNLSAEVRVEMQRKAATVRETVDIVGEIEQVQAALAERRKGATR